MSGFPARALRALCFLVAALGLGACAQLPPAQGRDELVLGIGGRHSVEPAPPHAELFLDYALLADQSYADSLYDMRVAPPFDVGPDTYCAARRRPGDPCRDVEGLTDHAIARLKRWRRIYAEKEAESFPCPPGRAGCQAPLPGLGVQVWVKAGRVCPEAAIVFRGTDGQTADDWFSNLRWLLRLLPLYDQYDQVQDYTPAFVRVIERERCFVRGRTRIVAIGHSLGGGLAQQAAFRDGRVRRVSAIDPSFVTGIEDLDPRLVAANSQGLGIDRLYERGEILSYPRFLLQQLDPPRECDPLVRTIRLDTLRGNPIEQHSLSSMATSLLAWSKERRAKGLRADLPLPGPTPATCRVRVARR
ncbi:alpha/beta fold hydrolase [Enterovirga aerilata]|uniref:Alpha/beta fold hydrolase n=1 Tax=Enterovirga aerilata TaxID=2730920 RepID=A0A849I7B2_9HYPH|nr:alpha/beta fold hydrolase [Enterovirga sp. DB1703]NNM72289.1 alpha/beta fold hydrolase [Enterovirga sp. DB1703]